MTPDEINKELEELESRLERLRVKYEQYFTGIEKQVPWVQRKDVDRRFQLMHREQLRSSGQRFRFNTLVQRFTTYQTYWGRILRRIEEGTLKRDVLRAQRLGTAPRRAPAAVEVPDAPEEPSDSTRHAARGEVDEMPAGLFGDDRGAHGGDEPLREDGFVDFGFSMPPPPPPAPPVAVSEVPPARSVLPPPGPVPPPEAARPRPMISAFAALRAPGGSLPPRAPSGALGRPTLPAPPAAAPPAPAAAPPVSRASGDDDVRALYDRYVAARRQTGEAGDVRFESIARQVRETLPKLAEKYQGAEVKLDVTIKDGKAVLRPVVTVKKK